MTRWQITGRRGALSVREDADDDQAALEQAIDKGYVHDGDEVIVEPAEELPIGFYGDDPEADAHDVGDYP